MTAPVCAVVLAAGRSRRLGRPKQLLPYRGTTLLGATLDNVRRMGFDQIIVTLGAAADDITARVDLHGLTVVVNDEHASGCASSIGAAIAQLDPRAAGAVLLLGDQPGIREAAARSLAAAASGAPLGACRYRDGLGHPFWLGRSIFPQLQTLHGDKAVWKLIDASGPDLVTVDVDDAVPLDVDTDDDYRALLAQDDDIPATGRAR
ncbi:nucleotidyltransferase family protein [Gordonia sp. NPDC003424]